MKEKVKAFFRRNPELKIKAKGLAQRLNLDDYEYEKLKAVLNTLVREGFLEKTGKRFKLIPQIDPELIGKFQYVPEGGYGFVKTKNPYLRDLFIPEKHMGTAFDGDTVKVELLAHRKGKNFEAKIIDVLERKREEIIGTLKKTKSFYYVEPEDEKIHRKIHIPKKALRGAKPEDKVVVTNIEWEDAHLPPSGVIKETLGKAGSYDVEIYSLARENGFSPIFPRKVLSAAKKIPVKISEEEIKNRLDFRKVTTFTIDPVDAKDFDDALSLRKLKNGNFEVGIHIADVSHYVRKGEAVYEEAKKRATSVYFVGKVVPMLPERLSNKICSLVPKEDRLTHSVIVEMTPRAKIVNYKIEKTVINSNKRFTYEEAQKILDKGKGVFYDELLHLSKLAKRLRDKRFRSGSINFHTPEVVFELDENGAPVDIKIKKDIETHHLVEEFMLLANRIVAAHVNKGRKKENPFVYRVHDLPDREKMIEFAKFVKSLGFSFNPDASNTPRQFQELLERVKGTEEEALINNVAIRSMAKAEYSTKNIGHYGLAFKFYTHFTSPIRRFPDLIVHDLIRSYVKKDKIHYSLKELDEICQHSSEQERNATTAERQSVKIKQVEYMKRHLGDVFTGVISGVTNFGMFIELTENLAEGLIRLRDLENDFYEYNEKQYSLVGLRTGKVYRLGDKVKVQVIRVDETRHTIDFLLVEDEPKKKKTGKVGKRSKKKGKKRGEK
jgi:ribonuclease R